MSLFKKVVKAEILEQSELSPDDEFFNYALGHMLGGEEGMENAYLYNECVAPETIFKITYSNGTTETIKVPTNSLAYKNYIKYVK